MTLYSQLREVFLLFGVPVLLIALAGWAADRRRKRKCLNSLQSYLGLPHKRKSRIH